MDAVEARPADLVLIGIHRANNSGAEATSLLLGLHPATVIIVFGSVDEIDVLAAAYIRGARGLIPWDPDQPPQHDKGNATTRLPFNAGSGSAGDSGCRASMRRDPI